MKMTFIIIILVLCHNISAFWIPRPPPPQSHTVCGRRPVLERPFSSFGSRLVGGEEAAAGTWPWMVSLQMYENHMCGGFLFNHWWVVTASHCFRGSNSDNKSWRIVLGTVKLSDLGPHSEIQKIGKRINYNTVPGNDVENDIAVIRLDKSVTYNDYIQPACIPTKDTDILKLTECYIIGWGQLSDDDNQMQDDLREAQIEMVDIERCNSTYWLDGEVMTYNLCAGFEEGGTDTCQGDSGGPIMCRKPDASIYSVLGVASWGYGCGLMNKPGVYTSIQYFHDWIMKTMAANHP